MRREYALRFAVNGQIAEPTDNERLVNVWRERLKDSSDYATIVYREVGEWQDDDQ